MEIANAAELIRRVEKWAEEAQHVGSVPMAEMLVTAEDARIMLEHNRRWQPPAKLGEIGVETNRPLAPMEHRVMWATDMVNGRWDLIHQGICFANDGRLLDGQTRLETLLYANEHWTELIDPKTPNYTERVREITDHGVRIPMLVSYGWDPKKFDKIDRGRPRTLQDLLALRGIPDRNNYAATLRLVYQFDRWVESLAAGNPRIVGTWKYRVPEHELMEYSETHSDALNDAVGTATRATRGSRILLSGAAAGLYVCRRAWPIFSGEEDLHDKFIEGLQHGYTENEDGYKIALDPLDARSALRAYLTSNDGMKAEKRNRQLHMALYIKTFNRYIRRQNVQIMRYWPDKEDFPRPIERAS